MLTPECKKLVIYEYVAPLAALKLLKRNSDNSYQWNSIEDCVGFLSDKGSGADGASSGGSWRHFRALVQSIIQLLKEHRELTISAVCNGLEPSYKTLKCRPNWTRRVRLAVKLLSLLGCVRVTKCNRRQKSIILASSANVRSCLVNFLQNANFTSKVDKKELKEKFDLICLKEQAERFIDRRRILKENGALFKPRTASFDITVVDRFLQKTHNLVVPNPPIVYKREVHGKEQTGN